MAWSRDEGRSEASLAPSSSWGSFSLAQEEMGIGMGTKAHCSGPSTPPLPPPQAKLLSPSLSGSGEALVDARDGTNGAADFQSAGQLSTAHPNRAVQAKHRPASLLPGSGSLEVRDGRNGAAQPLTGGVPFGGGMAANGIHSSRHDGHASTSGGASEPSASRSEGTGHFPSKAASLRPSPHQEQPVDSALGPKDKGGGERVNGRSSGLVSSGPLWKPQAHDSHGLRTSEDPGTSSHAPYAQQTAPLSSHSRDLLNMCA